MHRERYGLDEIPGLLPTFGSSILKRYLFDNISPDTVAGMKVAIETALRAEAPDVLRAFDIEVEPLPDQNTINIALFARSAVDQLADLVP